MADPDVVKVALGGTPEGAAKRVLHGGTLCGIDPSTSTAPARASTRTSSFDFTGPVVTRPLCSRPAWRGSMRTSAASPTLPGLTVAVRQPAFALKPPARAQNSLQRWLESGQAGPGDGAA